MPYFTIHQKMHVTGNVIAYPKFIRNYWGWKQRKQ